MLRLVAIMLVCLVVVAPGAMAEEPIIPVSDDGTHNWLDQIHQKINGIKAWLESNLNEFQDGFLYWMKTTWNFFFTLGSLPVAAAQSLMTFGVDMVHYGTIKAIALWFDGYGKILSGISSQLPEFGFQQVIQGNILLKYINVFFPLDLIATLSSLVSTIWIFYIGGGVILRIVRAIG